MLVILRANAGRSLFDPGNPASDAMRRAYPHRVALTRIGRIEVFQKIGGPDTGGVSPDGQQGRDRDFDIDDHACFQDLFERFARRDLPILRKAVLDGLARRIASGTICSLVGIGFA
ncbi:hypothetical protein [Shinella sp.]|uniref:DUF6925 family protein n=1 Tax=Shinella sp. TaxID=1870904 RepID=UPI00258E8866|nr:hypothetical protein [Shinella sp.]MCW5712669.1 hypothetical protein [Shinella sp.]